MGSEMCIRDSDILGQFGMMGRIGESVREKAGLAYYASSSLDMGCLLYTSDAADDLLCVDLGGRRIIKKKKQSLLHAHVRLLYVIVH